MRRSGFLWLALMVLAACSGSGSDPGALTRLTGKVYEPAAGVIVDVYKPGMDLRGPPYLQFGPLADGAFETELPPGEYLVVARRRADGAKTGPVRAGDLKSDPVRITVEPGKPLDLPILAYVKEGNTKQPLGEAAGWATAIRGRVVDAEGHPVEGVRVHVYDHIQMSERPKFVSAKTGPDGRYEVKLPEGGTYYICARDKYGGPPEVGELYGRYDRGTVDPSAVIVPEGQVVTGVDITVHKVW
ncbi:hypothetical protein JCM30394_18350 [Deferrisoma palaeochoriense]